MVVCYIFSRLLKSVNHFLTSILIWIQSFPHDFPHFCLVYRFLRQRYSYDIASLLPLFLSSEIFVFLISSNIKFTFLYFSFYFHLVFCAFGGVLLSSMVYLLIFSGKFLQWKMLIMQLFEYAVE